MVISHSILRIMTWEKKFDWKLIQIDFNLKIRIDISKNDIDAQSVIFFTTPHCGVSTYGIPGTGLSNIA